ncbi:MAG: hypothetical protein QM487_03165 [Candidatus Marithrix sp.]
MTIDIVREFLGWCSIINMGLLLWWVLFFMFAHGFIYRLHSKWFNLSVEKFDSIHYTGIAFFKITIFIFNIVPYLVLIIVD